MPFNDNYSYPEGPDGRLLLAWMNIAHTPSALWSLNQIYFPPHPDILDIGCGGGINIRRMLELCPEGRVVGIDVSEESLKKSKKTNRKYLGTRCLIRRGRAESLPFKDEAFSIVTAFETVYFWTDICRGFKEVRRVLKPDGKFVISCTLADRRIRWEEKIKGMTPYSPWEISDLMKEAGFVSIKIRRNKRVFCVCGYVRNTQ